jgi:Ca2+-binding RTX toxin-like protein
MAVSGRVNNITIEPVVDVLYSVTDAGGILPGPGCVPISFKTVHCAGEIHFIDVRAGDRNDTVTVTALDYDQSYVEGGAGDDNLSIDGGDSPSIDGDAGNDRLVGGRVTRDNAQPWDMTLSGGEGNDEIHGGPGRDAIYSHDDGADVIDGGGGTEDWVRYVNAPRRVNVTLDKIPDDGVAGEGDNVWATVENVIGSEYDDRIVGSPAKNVLDGHLGADDVTGGAGRDVLHLAGDRVHAFDGETDQLYCYGTSSGERDWFDRVLGYSSLCSRVTAKLTPPEILIGPGPVEPLSR